MSWQVDVPAATVDRAVAGDTDALEEVLAATSGPVYNLAVRFFWEPADAEDAAQEALVRILRGLPSFRGGSAFGTWCYRVAVNQFQTTRRRSMERLTIIEGTDSIDEGLRHDARTGTYDGPDAELLAEEVKLSCTTALLVCLSRPLRAAYILGDIVGMAGPEAAAVLDVKPATFRKRLSLARGQVRAFLAPRCGLVAVDNPCQCQRQVGYDLEVGWIERDRLRFAGRGRGPGPMPGPGSGPMPGPGSTRVTRALDAAFAAADVYRSQPDYSPPDGIRVLRGLLSRVDDLARVGVGVETVAGASPGRRPARVESASRRRPTARSRAGDGGGGTARPGDGGGTAGP